MPAQESAPHVAGSQDDRSPIPTMETASRPSAKRVWGLRLLVLVVLAALVVLVVGIVQG